MNFPAYGGRRFIMTMGCSIVSTLLLVTGHLSESGYLTITLSTVAAYITGNVAQRAIEKKGADDATAKAG